MLIQYRRFRYKINTGKTFKLSDTIKSTDTIFCPTTKLKYELVAYVNHIGDLPTNGHYTACIKHNNIWYMCDDNNIYVMTLKSELIQRG